MENWIYYLDALVGIALVGVGVGRWRWLRQRAAEGRGKRPGAWVVIRLGLAAFLLLHVWAQFRPVPVLVETRRLMTEAEKADLVKRGITMELVREIRVAESKPFNGSNATGWSWIEIYKVKGLLAWTAILPPLPKELLIREWDTFWNFPSGTATYNWVGLTYKVISFNKRNGQWEMPDTCFRSGCGITSTNQWDEVIAQVRLGLRIY